MVRYIFTFFIMESVSKSVNHSFRGYYHSLLMRRLFSPMARLPGESGSALLSRLITEGLKLTLLTALEGGCNLVKKNSFRYTQMYACILLLLMHGSGYLMNKFGVGPFIRIRIDALGDEMPQLFRIVVRRQGRIITLLNFLAQRIEVHFVTVEG